MSGPPPNPSFPSLAPQINAGTVIPRPEDLFGSGGRGGGGGAMVKRDQSGKAHCPYCGHTNFLLKEPTASWCLWLMIPVAGPLYVIFVRPFTFRIWDASLPKAGTKAWCKKRGCRLAVYWDKWDGRVARDFQPTVPFNPVFRNPYPPPPAPPPPPPGF